MDTQGNTLGKRDYFSTSTLKEWQVTLSLSAVEGLAARQHLWCFLLVREWLPRVSPWAGVGEHLRCNKKAMRFFDWLKTLSGGTLNNSASATVSPTLEDDHSDIDPFNPFPDPVELPLDDIIDLHTMQARDVKRVVEEYLHQAHEAGFPLVRIIHGKGVGVQREIVRSVLASTPYVHDWTDAPPEAGGLGATIVRFKQ